MPPNDLNLDLAAQRPECFGGRMVGGGFGGCTLNLVRAGMAEQFIEAVLPLYRAKTQQIPRAFAFDLVAGASVRG